MTDTEQLKHHISQFLHSIPPQVRTIAVTKQVSIEAMRAAYAAGVRDFGENRIQEAEAKQAKLQDLPDVTWHFIGHLQSNKAQRAVELFDWIQSVDSLKLAQRIDRLAKERNRRPQVCLQVKLLNDPNKSGWSIDQLRSELPLLDQLENVQIRGLMIIAPIDLKTDETLLLFQSARDLARKIEQQGFSRIQMDQLSMGMSDDYETAIQAGATMIRPGRVLFGVRTPIK